jgi:hypothetical protein
MGCKQRFVAGGRGNRGLGQGSRRIIWYAIQFQCTLLEARSLRQLFLPCYGAYSSILGALYARVRDYFVQVVSHRRLCDRAHVLRAGLEHVWVVGRQDGCRGADDRAECIIHLLCFGLVDGVLENRA